MVDSNKEIICPTCNGKGVVPNPQNERLIPWWTIFLGVGWLWHFSKIEEIICQDCDGKGKITNTDYEKNVLKSSVPILQTKYGIDSEGKPFRLDVEII
jgi:RecJ-like exonuclease